MEKPIAFYDRIAKNFKVFAIHMVGSFRDLIPIICVIAVFQLLVLRQPFPELFDMIIGLVLVIFGLTLEAQTDVVLFLQEASLVALVLDSIYKAGCLKAAGTGIAFVIDVEHAVGLESQLEHFRRAAENHD
jgi:hypothetical protein